MVSPAQLISGLSQGNAPLIMGILNITPDSFSDGGQLYNGNGPDRERVLRHAQAMIEAGADLLDVGGESTRPGAEPVSLQQEIDRVIPVLEWLADETDIPVSVDSSSPQLMKTAAAKGAALINDVRALQRPGAIQVVVESGLPVCLMHMPAEPQEMQQAPVYQNVVKEVTDFLLARVDNCLAAGIAPQQIIIDPGFGFGKTLAHNLALFNGLDKLVETGYPVLVGVSRKSMIGVILNKPVEQRTTGSVALALMAAQRGAAILRVHDVAQTVDALKIWKEVEQHNRESGSLQPKHLTPKTLKL